MSFQSDNALDKWASRVLFFRYLGIVLLFLVVFLFIGVFSYKFWNAVRPDNFVKPNYTDLDPLSEMYWSDRMERDIVYINKMNVSAIRKSSRLRTLVSRQIGVATELESHYERNHAILSIAKILTKYDLDVNIDKTLRTMDETYETYSIRARIYISIALMQVRQKNFVGAMSAYAEYKRLVNHADLKLDTPENEESFIGAVTVLLVAQNIDELSDLFRVQTEFTRRISSNQRMRAYRLIAVEQARSGSFLQNSLNTLRMIRDTVEMSRAIQLVLTYVARPPHIEPVEPFYPVPPSDGPWEHVRSTLVVRNTIDNILRIIVNELPEYDLQRNVLLRISGSILMCDPDVYNVFKSAVKEMKDLDEVVKIPVIKLLDNPVSDKIRTELKMPPRPKRRGNRNINEGTFAIDPAVHDWVDENESLDMMITTIDADMLESIDVRQYTRILSISANSFLQFNRRNESKTTLEDAYQVAFRQTSPAEQLREFVNIAELQFDSGAIGGAMISLQTLTKRLTSRTKVDDADYDEATPVLRNEITDEQILNIVNLQILAHLFQDAAVTAGLIQSIELRDSGLVLITRELLRTNQLDNVEKIIAQISDTTTQNEYKHRLIIANAEAKAPIQSTISITLPPESVKALGINNPAATPNDNDEKIARNVSQLIRFGFLESALITAKHISDANLRSKLLAQIGREYILIFTAYSNRQNADQTVADKAFNNAIIIAEIIPDTNQRVLFILSIIDAVSANKNYAKDSEILNQFFDLISADIENIDSNNKNSNVEIQNSKGEIQSMFLLSRVKFEMLRAGDKSGESVEVKNELDMNFANKILNELQTEEPTISKARGLLNISTAFLLAGKLNETTESAKLTETTAESLLDRSEMIEVLVDLLPIYHSLKDTTSFARVTNRAIDLAISFIPAGIDLRRVNIAWRTRDIELDRIARKLAELDLIDDAMTTIANVHEPIISDRVIRAIIYIHLTQTNFPAAESATKKLRLPEYRFAAKRDTNLMKYLTKQK
ncbi:MAG: hypothetical protein LBK06_03755 [Planctomycetaceae bacterium]|jgi:hypothetical protein|nr:hypothetical protein [Planctomycetaceae bacterium]